MRINRQQFLKELTWAARFCERKTSIPILNYVALTTSQNRLMLVGTDLAIGGISLLEAETAKPWSVAIPPKLAIRYLQQLTAESVTLTADTDRITISDGCNERATVMGLGTEAYPVLPIPPVRSTLPGIVAAVPRILTSIAAEENRFTINGALLEMDQAGIRLVATDGHRLSLVELPEVPRAAEPLRTLVGRRALEELKPMQNGSGAVIEFGWDDNHHLFRAGHRTLVSRALKGAFPEYQRVIPDHSDHVVGLAPQEWSRALERVSVFADERSHAVRLRFGNGQLTFEAGVTDTGMAQSALAAPPDLDGWEAGYNALYLQDFLRVAGEAATFEFSKATEAVVLRVPQWAYAVMPLRMS